MVRAYHVIFSAYGFWLPNDPRGSWSDFVRAWELLKFGRATKVHDRRSHAHDEHDRAVREAAKRALKYPPVVFNGVQARAVGRGFAKAIVKSGYIVHACSILPEHVHAVIARHSQLVERIIAHLKGAATMQLIEEGIHPLRDFATKRGTIPTPWAQRKGWVVYLNNRAAIEKAIAYVEEKPVKEGKARQSWPLVRLFEG